MERVNSTPLGCAWHLPLFSSISYAELFCTIKLLHSGHFFQHVLEGLFLVIRASIVRWDQDDEYQPMPAHAEHSRRVLELCYYGRDLHALSTSRDEVERRQIEQSRRMTKGRTLMRVCQGDWSSCHIHHWSTGSPRCCTNDAEASACVYKAVLDVIGQAIPVPALNKWTQIWPAVAALAQGYCLHQILPRAIEYAHTLSVPLNASDVAEAEDVDEDGEADQGAEVGLPRDARKAIAKEKAARSKKSFAWIKRKDTLCTLLTWLCVSQHVMRLHFWLFRDAGSVCGAVQAEGKHPIFNPRGLRHIRRTPRVKINVQSP